MTTSAIRTVDTPHGPLTLVASDHGLTRATFRTVRRAAPRPHPAAHAWLDLAHRELDAYFAGELRQFTVPVDLSRVDDAHRRILDALAELPYGRTTTYGALATRLGLVDDGPRQVGAAMARNPVADRRALPPRPRRGQHPHRLRGRPRRQAGPARPRTPRPARPAQDGHVGASTHAPLRRRERQGRRARSRSSPSTPWDPIRRPICWSDQPLSGGWAVAHRRRPPRPPPPRAPSRSLPVPCLHRFSATARSLRSLVRRPTRRRRSLSPAGCAAIARLRRDERQADGGEDVGVIDAFADRQLDLGGALGHLLRREADGDHAQAGNHGRLSSSIMPPLPHMSPRGGRLEKRTTSRGRIVAVARRRDA